MYTLCMFDRGMVSHTENECKWCIVCNWEICQSLMIHSVSLSTVPFFDGRRQNTIEKMIENLQKDEDVLQDMLEKSARLHSPHQVCACYVHVYVSMNVIIFLFSNEALMKIEN